MQYETKFCVNCATPLQWIVTAEDSGDVNRLRCPACGWTHWGNPTPVLAAVVENDDGQVLLARNALWQEGVFGLITGFMEAGESPLFPFVGRGCPAKGGGLCRNWAAGTTLQSRARAGVA